MKKTIFDIVVVLTIISVIFTSYFGVMLLDDDDFIAGFLIFAPILTFCINYIIAYEFSDIAAKKGFLETKYFWYCFLLGFFGALMVIALPDRGV